jgi:uncharacterized FAD-dependent dehydrogenase
MSFLSSLVEKEARRENASLTEWHIVKKSIDARKRPFYLLQVDAYFNGDRREMPTFLDRLQDVSKAPEVIIIGAGPAGYFAALQLIELGYKPIVLERGKDVRARRRDLKAIQQDGVVNPHSNYCFGEGGAGTYSDGKLYTRSYKRGKIEKVLHLLVEHGAKEDILIDAHPHIGSNKLPNIISNIRKTIEERGGQVLFDHYVVDFKKNGDKITAVEMEDGKILKSEHIILATGHSARDIFHLLERKEILIEAKPFALGIRIEHPQAIIDETQYGRSPRSEFLPASSYALKTQVDKNGVFSFCMCPGGLIVPAATSPGEIVVNGMSLSRRDSAYANSGVVTSIELEELKNQGYTGVFASLDLQKKVEQDVFKAGDGSQKAPAQRMTDFINGRNSTSLNESSYIPGLYATDLAEVLPEFIHKRLKRGLLDFGKKMKNYHTEMANVVAVESRTSSPIKIPRNRESFQHLQIKNLYPCGEGAGYAGGILSAAMDGQNVAIAVGKSIEGNQSF